MIDPKSSLKCVTIESSKESKAAGEYVIDLAEYSENETDGKTIVYFQLKHTTVRTGKKFALAELKSTLAGFAKRYSACFIQNRGKFHKGAVTFSFVTNRPVSIRLKQGINAIRIGSNAPRKLQNDLERITKLTGAHLHAFCASLTFKDGEGDYIVQKTKLRGEMAEYIAGFIDSTEVDNLIALIADRALPESEDHRKNGEIYPEDILRRLDVTSERDLFPAPPEFEKLPHIIKREQHQDILKHIFTTPGPTIIHAAGGVGKSVVAQQLVDSLPSGSVGIIYDCFGAGKYRNISEPRHRAQDALVQMANEMATRGLCRPLISRLGTPSDVLFRGFKERIRQASNKLREVNKDALLVLLIDAADNAEVAANENNDKSFARALLRESIPSTCRLIAFCRTERRDLLEPLSTVHLYELAPFSKAETALHLRRHYPNATDHDIEEFHRLTGGNPRVQAYALNAKDNSVDAVLMSLGPAGTTVNDQIADQLRSAISGIKDKSPQKLKSQVDAVCRGLANLPPFIPLEVLAKAAGVDIPTIKSFVSDLGRPLWHSDDAVQFRDEPTETWFRETFSAGKDQINQYASTLEPLAKKYTYVAKVLPQLLLKSENYQRLVTLALSNELLPENNPIDERDIRVYRLQFAFKAAIKLRHLADAAHLAFRAGEEVAGDKRQLDLLQQNIDLIALLQDTHRVQELAHRQLFHSAWLGSENLYSASLLSSVKDFHGEARSFLRAARKWLNIYFEERDLHKKDEAERSHHKEQLEIKDLAEFAWIYYNLYGAAEVVKFMTGWKPSGVVLSISSLFVQRLVDAGRFDEINEIARLGTKNPYLMLAVTDELAAVAKFPPKQSLKYCLDLLTNPRTRIPKPQQHAFEDMMTPIIISFAEASAARGLSHKKISALLEFYTAAFADRSVVSEFPGNSRRTFFRGAALRATVAGHFKPEIKTLLPPKDDSKKATHSDGENEKELTQIIDVLLPWHMLRARLLVCDSTASEINLEALFSATESTLEHRYRIHDRLPFEISRVHFEVLALKKVATSQELESFANNVIHNPQRKFTLIDCLRAVRASFRLQHLAVLRIPLEESCSSAIEAPGTEGPEERSNSFIELARAVLPVSQADAAAYFNQAIEAVSKFGDEMVERWEAVVAVAKRAATAKRPVPELAYRFIRCGEMVGDTVAREKYWNRNAVFRTAIHLDAPGTFAALSRWRDRNVGWFDDQLEALATEAVKSGILNPVTGWCLSAFEGCNNSADFAATCIRQECNISIRQHILDTAIRDFELSNAPKESWQTLEAVADEFHLQKGKLPVFQSASSTKYSPCHPPTPSASLNKRNKTPDWNKLFKGINLLGPNGVGEAIGAFHKLQLHSSFDDFWRELVRRIPAGKEIDFLNKFIATDNLDIYNVDRVITAVRTTWSQKAAVKALWPALLKRIGRHFAPVLADGYHLNFWIRDCHLKDEDVAMLKNAMLDGLAESLDLVDASTFFGFIRQVSGRITEAEACDLLNFSITRFELHIPNDFGDGLWAEWLSAPAEAPDAVTGLIWAALGSPHAAMRWEAAHCVRRLADYPDAHGGAPAYAKSIGLRPQNTSDRNSRNYSCRFGDILRGRTMCPENLGYQLRSIALDAGRVNIPRFQEFSGRGWQFHAPIQSLDFRKHQISGQEARTNSDQNQTQNAV